MTKEVKSQKQAKVSKILKVDNSAKEVLNQMFDAIKPVKLPKVKIEKPTLRNFKELQTSHKLEIKESKVLGKILESIILNNPTYCELAKTAKISHNYNILSANCKKGKNGNYSSYFVKIALRKLESEFL